MAARSIYQRKFLQDLGITKKMMDGLLNIKDFERLSSKILSLETYSFFGGGANDEITLRQNINSYGEIYLKTRNLVDVSKRSLSTTILGQEISMPVLIAPMAFQKLAHESGEIATAKAASSADTIMIVSSLATASLAAIAASSKISPWFQLYVYKNREITKNLIGLAENEGYKALVLTIDVPVYGRRERERRTQFNLPKDISPINLIQAGLNSPNSSILNYSSYLSSQLDPSISWKDINWLKSITKLPIILKGIMSSEDALLATEHGVAGIVVSNHGGRQLDTAPSTIQVLKDIVETVQNKIDIILDGGIQRGTDILKALAFGAKAVLVGRPILWGLAVGQEKGVVKVLDILREELDLCMALCGCTSIETIDKKIIYEISR